MATDNATEEPLKSERENVVDSLLILQLICLVLLTVLVAELILWMKLGTVASLVLGALAVAIPTVAVFLDRLLSGQGWQSTLSRETWKMTLATKGRARVSCGILSTTVLVLGLLLSYEYFTSGANLVVRAQPEQLLPLVKDELPVRNGQPVYCESVRVRLSVSHNQKKDHAIAMESIGVEVKMLEATDLLEYQIDLARTKSHGVKEVELYEIGLQKKPTAKYIESAEAFQAVDIKNIFRRNNSTTVARVLTTEADDSKYLADIALTTVDPGLYEVHFNVGVDVLGRFHELETECFYVFRKP